MHIDATSPRNESADLTFTVISEATERLDRFLADQLEFSRTQAARMVAAGRVMVDGDKARASRLLSRGETVKIFFPIDQPPRNLKPYPIDLEVVYEDDHLAVIDKPAGLVVHPAPGHWDDTLVNALVARGTTLSGGIEGRPGIVHRLDMETSGLMVVAKTDLAHGRLGTMLAARRIQRVYAALAWGHLDEDRVIESPMARHSKDRKRMAIRPDGREARTDAFVVARFESVDLLRLELHSGRTHQIRLHLESIGHPVVGDQVYRGGGARRITGSAASGAKHLEASAPRQALHAAILAFRHPITGKEMRFTASWPADLWPLMALALGTETGVKQTPLTQHNVLSSMGFDRRDE